MPLSPTHEDAVRQLDRLADRLRVVGPRLAAREGAAARELIQEVRAGLQQMADLAADADARRRRAVPPLAPHALADQALVLGHDLLGHDLLGHDLVDPDPVRSDVFLIRAVEAIEGIRRLL